MRKKVFVVLIGVFITCFSFGQDKAAVNDNFISIFSQANEAYAAEDYSGSLELYQRITDSGNESAELYFNMGNAYYKLNDLPNALLYFEKAKKMDPEDEDIRTNIEIANLKTVDKVESKPELPFESWWKELLNSNRIDEWAQLCLYMIYIALVLFVLFIFSGGLLKKISFFGAMIFVSLSLVYFIMGWQLKSDYINNKEGIVFSSTVTVKSAPDDDATRLFVIHEGTKIEVLDVSGEWSEISLMNGSKGWVKTETFKII